MPNKEPPSNASNPEDNAINTNDVFFIFFFFSTMVKETKREDNIERATAILIMNCSELFPVIAIKRAVVQRPNNTVNKTCTR